MKVLDVGGAYNTHKDATHVIDIIPAPEECKATYTQMDICSGPWPFPDKFFDMVYCTETLEDIRDPIFVCKELTRVAKAGMVTFPHFSTELTKNVDNWVGRDRYAGYTHHRWIVLVEDNKLKFIPKWATIHTFDWYPTRSKDDKNTRVQVDWQKQLLAEEVLITDWTQYYNLIAGLTGNPKWKDNPYLRGVNNESKTDK